jgi:hypothetical protein
MKQPNNEKWDESHDIEFADWKRVRGEIEHENTLNNYRLTWFVLSQGLLFTAFTSASKFQTRWVIPCVGILICFYLGIHLYGGAVEHEKLRKWWNEKYGEKTSFDDERCQKGARQHPPLCGCDFGGNFMNWFFRRVVAIYLFPLNFVVGWTVLLLWK